MTCLRFFCSCETSFLPARGCGLVRASISESTCRGTRRRAAAPRRSTRHWPRASSSMRASARAAHAAATRSHRRRGWSPGERDDLAAAREVGAGQDAVALPRAWPPGCGSAAGRRPRRLRAGCAAGSRSPCPPRCPRRRSAGTKGRRAGSSCGSSNWCRRSWLDEVDRAAVDLGQQQLGDRRQPAFGVAHRRRPSRRRASRSCPGRRSAGSASRTACAMCTMRLVHVEESPCGWYLPSTSPTYARALHMRSPGRVGMSPIAYRMRRCTGFRPSARPAGRARDFTTLIA
jgi:hypothetical protein